MYSRLANGQDDRKGGPRGFDAGKKIQGRKRHLVVDTLGFILAVVVHPASQQDRDGARPTLEQALARHPTLKKCWADGGYAGALVEWSKELGLDLEIVKKPQGEFVVLPKRWIVERTFGWIVRNRRLRCDYEASIESSVGYVLLAMIRIMIRRLGAVS